MGSQPNRLLISGGRVVDPGQGIDRVADVVVTGGKVSRIGKADAPRLGDELIDARGLVVCPGFIDLHCHLRQPGFEEKETIATGSRAAAKGGFTTICCMPNTQPPPDSREVVDFTRSVAAAEAIVRVLPVGCISRGRRGDELVDMRALAAAGVVGFSDDGAPAKNSCLMLQALTLSCELNRPVIDHCEDTSLTTGGQMNEGETSARLGIRGMPAVAEEIIVARDLALAELTGGWFHVAHASTEGSVRLIREAKERGIRVTAEVTPHHLTLTESEVARCGAQAKVNPPLRTEKDVQALVGGLREGVIDIIATDHAPHAAADKDGPFDTAAFGISGLETALGSLMALVHSGELTLSDLIARLTSGPAKILGDRYGRLGTLAAGAPADITIFNPEREWRVDTGAFASRGRNTPLAGAMLKGKVMATIYRGEVVYRDDSLSR